MKSRITDSNNLRCGALVILRTKSLVLRGQQVRTYFLCLQNTASYLQHFEDYGLAEKADIRCRAHKNCSGMADFVRESDHPDKTTFSITRVQFVADPPDLLPAP